MVSILAIYVYHYDADAESDVTYDIVGTYRGAFSGDFVYYVFEPSGVPSIVIDEGTYKNREDRIFALESTMNQEHTVVCGNNKIYDFDMTHKEVYFADKTTREISYVNLPERVADHPTR